MICKTDTEYILLKTTATYKSEDDITYYPYYLKDSKGNYINLYNVSSLYTIKNRIRLYSSTIATAGLAVTVKPCAVACTLNLATLTCRNATILEGD